MRGAILFECAIFVNRIRNGWSPPSLEVNNDGYKNLLLNFKYWGEAIGSKLEILEELDQSKMSEEEPVLPREASKGITCWLVFQYFRPDNCGAHHTEYQWAGC